MNFTPDGGVRDVPAAINARDPPAVTADSVIFGLTAGVWVGMQPTAFVIAVGRNTSALKWKT